MIEDAIEAHKGGRYTLSIPALLPLVDGLAAELLPHSQGTAHIKQAANQHHSIEGEEWSAGLVSVIEDRIYANYAGSHSAALDVLNRHAVLHGRTPTYATEANSMRTILLIDKFAEVVGAHRAATTSAAATTA